MDIRLGAKIVTIFKIKFFLKHFGSHKSLSLLIRNNQHIKCLKFALCVNLCQHEFTTVIVVKLQVLAHS